jgi:hypothetical protein
MTTAIQKIALNKFKGNWFEEGNSNGSMNLMYEWPEEEHDLDDHDKPSPHVSTSLTEPIEMTRSEADALKGWLRENHLSERNRLSVEGVVPGQFALLEWVDFIPFALENMRISSPLVIPVETLTPNEGEIMEKYGLVLHRNDFQKLQIEYFREGWFSLDNRDTGEPKSKLPPFGP